MICEEKNGKMFIFLLIFQKIDLQKVGKKDGK
jgi:hypothetical protein